MSTARVPVSGFRECDIRGTLDAEITGALAYKLGRALGTLSGDDPVVVGGDFRASTPALLADLMQGLVDSGNPVIALGQVTTPAYYFARRHLHITTGVMVTASHNPAHWNGFKIITGNHPITPQELDALKQMVLADDFTSGSGTVETVDIGPAYVAWLAQRFAALKGNAPRMVLDCGNGATGWIIEQVNAALDLNAHLMLTEPDGTFPHRSPDIAKPDDLALLAAEVLRQGAQIGAGFDGDGDRVGIVDHTGQRVPPDRLIAWLAGELVQQHGGGAVVCDLKLSKAVTETVIAHGGTPVQQKSGHTFIKGAMLENDAVFGGEYSGHLFFRELQGGDDALYAALLIMSMVQAAGRTLADLVATIPRYPSTPDIRIPYAGNRAALIAEAVTHARATSERTIELDGVKAYYPEGWALLRASVTEPAVTLRFEGDDVQHVRTVAEKFLGGLDPIREAVWREVLAYTGESDAGTE